jgi:hypothetical protein
MYVAVRQDLSHPQQVVQACHAVIESVMQTPPQGTHPNVIVCAVRDERRLLGLARRLSQEGVAFRVFSEPDRGGECTALATETVRGERRRVFRALQLLAAPQGTQQEGGRDD